MECAGTIACLSPYFLVILWHSLERKSDLTPCRTFVILNNWAVLEKKYLINGHHLFIWKTAGLGEVVFVFKIFIYMKDWRAWVLYKGETKNPELLLSFMACSLFRKSLINFVWKQTARGFKETEKHLEFPPACKAGKVEMVNWLKEVTLKSTIIMRCK